MIPYYWRPIVMRHVYMSTSIKQVKLSSFDYIETFEYSKIWRQSIWKFI